MLTEKQTAFRDEACHLLRAETYLRYNNVRSIRHRFSLRRAIELGVCGTKGGASNCAVDCLLDDGGSVKIW
jgi:hypothetical protein